jgi:hypothetical protein
VTWFDTSAHEADMALNTKFPWSTDGVHDYDVQTVFLHEEGHVAGLGHSTYTTAIMYPSYSGVRQVLGPDDIAGIQSLYPDGATSTTGSISGVVTDVSSALAISNASVNTDTGETTATDINGNYSLGSVPTGTRTVTVSAAGYATQSGSVTVNDGQNTIASFSLTPTTGSISGTVTNASSGSPIPAAHVSVDTGQSFDTGADGTYILTNVPAGTRTVTASASGYASDSQAAGVTGGQTTNGIDFALTASAGATTVSVTAVTYSTHGGKNSDKHLDVTVALVDNLGSPVAGASVSMELDNGTGYSSSFAGTTGTDGTVTFTANNIPSGTYTTTGTVTPPNGLNWDGNWPTDSYTKP